MILRRMRLINKNQRGFTLIELLIAIAITGLVSGGITMTLFQVFNINALSTNHMIAVRQVQNAGYWISRDAQMAQSMVTTGVSGFPLTLTWSEWDGTVNQATYTIIGGELERSHSINGGDPTKTLVAQYIDIDPNNTNYGLSGGSAFSLPDANMGVEDAFTITDAVGGDSGTITVTTPGSVVQATPVGGATVAGGFDTVTINISSGAVSWATPVAGSQIIIIATAIDTFGSWTSTSGNATATITTDINDNTTFSGTSNSMLSFMITATVGTGSQETSETRVYEVNPRPNL